MNINEEDLNYNEKIEVKLKKQVKVKYKNMHGLEIIRIWGITKT